MMRGRPGPGTVGGRHESRHSRLEEGALTTASQQWTDQSLEVAGCRLAMMTAGTGDPLLVLHHDIGNHAWLPFFDRLAERFTVHVPSHPGFDRSERLD
jgi:hypothetical protein